VTGFTYVLLSITPPREFLPTGIGELGEEIRGTASKG
jgi:hypothetical protein